MKEEALVMTIDYGKNHFNAVYLNNQLKLISSDGCMITVDGTERFKVHEQTANTPTNLFDFLNINDS